MTGPSGRHGARRDHADAVRYLEESAFDARLPRLTEQYCPYRYCGTWRLSEGFRMDVSLAKHEVSAGVQISDTALAWTLRIAAFMCFVGHGAFGIVTKQAWVPYFAVAGVGRDAAYTLMPLIGAVDITLGCLILLRPRPAIALWMVVWAVWTALLRPLAGEPVWEAVERAGNYGVPATLLILMSRGAGWRGLFGRDKTEGQRRSGSEPDARESSRPSCGDAG